MVRRYQVLAALAPALLYRSDFTIEGLRYAIGQLH